MKQTFFLIIFLLISTVAYAQFVGIRIGIPAGPWGGGGYSGVGGGGGSSSPALLLESGGGYILLETGGKILIEP